MEDKLKKLESKGIVEWHNISLLEDTYQTYLLKIRGKEYIMEIHYHFPYVVFKFGDMVLSGAMYADVENAEDLFCNDTGYKNYFVFRDRNKEMIAYIPLEESEVSE